MTNDPIVALLLIAALIAASAFFSLSELAVAASRRVRLRQLADAGDPRAHRVLAVQDEPGDFFTAIQIGMNAVAILGGVVGEGAFSPYFTRLLHALQLDPAYVDTAATLLSFVLVTSLFILIADLFPKRLGMIAPEQVALRVVGPMQTFLRVVRPLVWFFKRLTDGLFHLFGLPDRRDEAVTSDDILAMAQAGTEAGVLAATGQQVIENVFELDTRLVTSAMTPRDRIVHLLLGDSEAVIRARIEQQPHSTYLVCDGDIDHVVGYVDSKDLLSRVFNGQPIVLQGSGLIKKVLMVPERISLTEVLGQFRQAYEDFAVIVNEYSLVVGIITLNDVMSTVMGSLLAPLDDELIVQRDADSWLMDGVTPIEDVLRALNLDDLPRLDEYETLAGFMMVTLRRVPRKTDHLSFGGFRFEVMDVDSHRIDQVMVIRERPTSPAGGEGQDQREG
ncbi:hemolysin family protein [Aquabacterium parvum]|uniref:hemolysin family protein n=1 Tax=Aquabacterium parvum TaxID=70584 RepID=UPI000718C5BD|nr:hemolysin family protein [Aquabacterium parvum]MBU0914818.1 hemolysin family protein [Gammaproteobacteria bacterium]